MSEELVDIRTPLAMSKNAGGEMRCAGVLHVLASSVTVHMGRPACEGLTTTLARARVVLAKLHGKTRPAPLEAVRDQRERHDAVGMSHGGRHVR